MSCAYHSHDRRRASYRNWIFSFYRDVKEDGLALVYIDRYVQYILQVSICYFLMLCCDADTLYMKLQAHRLSRDCEWAPNL